MLLSSFDGPVWRAIPERLMGTPMAPASAPEGRFHQSGQTAVYASLTAQGAVAAVQKYLYDRQSRMLVPMWLQCDAIVDLRGCAIALSDWQSDRSVGNTASTWAVSNEARRLGAQGLLFSSPSRRDLSHIVIFRLNLLKVIGPIKSMAVLDT